MDDASIGLLVQFYEVHEIDKARTQKEGRPIVKTREMVRLRSHKDPRNERVFYAEEIHRTDKETGAQISYREAFPEAYRKFLASRETEIDGTAIELAHFLTGARRVELREAGVRTVDALAEMTAKDAAKLGPDGPEIVKKAKAYMRDAADTSRVKALAAENAALREAKAKLEERVQELNAQVDALAKREGPQEQAA